MKPVRQTRNPGSYLLLTMLCVSGCSRLSQSTVSAPIPGNPIFNGGQFPLAPLGYQEQEYFFSGTATTYKPSVALAEDGRWSVVPAPARTRPAPFTSRLVVIRPTSPARFNGTVVVEWLNVTNGSDQPAEWIYVHRELLREGYAYVGVSAQRVSIEGGSGSFPGGKSLKQLNAARYGALHHPGDAYSYDIFSQAGHLVRSNASSILGPLKPLLLIAVGESQSAVFLTTYVNAIDPIAKIFDGYLLHSRFGFASGLGGEEDGSPSRGQPKGSPVRIRADVRVPVLMTITETDLLAPVFSFLRARQPDTDHIRTWEIAGTAHADNYAFGLGGIDSGSAPIAQLAAGFGSLDTIAGHKLDVPINSAPQHHYVEQAAIHSLNLWLINDTAPPVSPVLEVAPGDPPRFILDRNGNVRGGIRSPWVDVPTSTLSGLGQSGSGFLSAVGTTRPFSPAQLRALYPHGRPDYLAQFDASLRSAIQAGFILESDHSEIEELAADSYPAGSSGGRVELQRTTSSR